MFTPIEDIVLSEEDIETLNREEHAEVPEACEWCGGTGIREDANGVDHKCVCRADCGHDAEN